jgi:undecaprenyl-diphosphatase|tara:strand:+ start:656 stop:1234 length:579 start_codon:yes stop_codon:yes gene_type:complete
MLDFFQSVDMNLIKWIHQYFSNTLFDIFMPIITNKKNWTLPIIVLIFLLGFFSGPRGKIALTVLIISLSFTDAICAQILKPFFERIRPSHLNLEEVNLLTSKGGKWSMPSNHAANMFSLAIVLSYFYKKYKPLLFLLAILISFSRVYVGVHFPGDVIVGGFIGVFISSIFLILWGKIKLNEIKKGRNWVLIE